MKTITTFVLLATIALAGAPMDLENAVIYTSACHGPSGCGHVHVPNIQTVGMNSGVVTWAGGAVTFVFDDTTPLPNLEAGSDTRAAANAGANEWVNVSNFTFTDGGLVSIPAANGGDGQNVVTFATNATNAMVVGGAVAVASQSFNSALNFTDVDIIFNSTLNFSTLGSAGNFDVQSVACHEFGHAFGLNHSAVASATMFPFTSAGQLDQRTINADDVAGMNTLYPTDISFWGFGTITGSISESAAPLYGAHVVARSVTTGTTFSAGMSLQDGTYSITGLPPGGYHVYAEPLDGPVTDGNITSTFFGTGKDVTFQTTFFGGNATPTIVRVQPTMTTSSIDIAVSGAQTLNFSLIGEPATGTGGFSASSGGFEVTSGTSTFIAVAGPGVSSLADSAFSMPGTGVTFGPNSTASGSIGADTFKTFPLTVAPGAPAGPRDIIVDIGSELAVYCGVIEIVDPAMPVAEAFAYGTASPGTAGMPDLTVSAAPQVGQSVTFDVANLVNGEVSILVFSLNPDFIDIGNGVSQWVRSENDSLLLQGLDFAQTVAGGTSSYIGSIPPVASLAGLEIYVQAFASDAGAAASISASNGLHLLIEQ